MRRFFPYVVAALISTLLPFELRSARGQDPALLSGGSAAIVDLALSPDEKALGAATESGEVVLWDLTVGEKIVLAANGTAKSVQFTSDGTRLLSGSASEVVVWNLESRSGERVLSQNQGRSSRRMIASSDGRRVAIGGGSGYAVYDVTSDVASVTITDADGPAAIASAGDLAAFGSTDAVRLFDLAGKKELEPIRGLPDRPRRLAFNPNGKVLAIGLSSET